jgi:hypothetical protein
MAVYKPVSRSRKTKVVEIAVGLFFYGIGKFCFIELIFASFISMQGPYQVCVANL